MSCHYHLLFHVLKLSTVQHPIDELLYYLSQMFRVIMVVVLFFRYCLLLVLPFWYKTDQLIKEKLSILFFGSYQKKIEDNIWNLFGNRLPIEMPLV